MRQRADYTITGPRIIELYNSGFSSREISDIIFKEFNINYPSGTLRHFIGENCTPRTQSEGHALKQIKRKIICKFCGSKVTTVSYNQRWCDVCTGKGKYFKRVTAHKIPVPILEFMLKKQESKCKICKKEFPNGLMNAKNVRHVVIDHDHSNESVRGFLCMTCNTGLSYVDNTSWLKAAHEYLNDVKSYHDEIHKEFPRLENAELPRFPKLIKE